MFKVYMNKSPGCRSNMFANKKDKHNYNTRQKIYLLVKKNNHEYVYWSFIYQGVNI